MEFQEVTEKGNTYTLFAGKEFPGISFPVEKMIAFPYDMYREIQEGKHIAKIKEVLKIDVTGGEDVTNNLEAMKYLDKLMIDNGFTPRWAIIEGEERRSDHEFIPLTPEDVKAGVEIEKRNLALDFSKMDLSKF